MSSQCPNSFQGYLGNPGPAVDDILMHFSRISDQDDDIEIPPFIQTLIILSKLPDKYKHIDQLLSLYSLEEVQKMSLETLRGLIVSAWETEKKRKGDGQNQVANRLSAIKRKKGDPNFSQQQQR